MCSTPSTRIGHSVRVTGAMTVLAAPYSDTVRLSSYEEARGEFERMPVNLNQAGEAGDNRAGQRRHGRVRQRSGFGS
ncbi:hypothetical protein GCM10022402_07760 [Salinactinospora qingdaonensis]|uniref:Uncharacterized protein n=1 Tax=Salinactinospora qingdaonensis TaxID=702744 RepID=A0ABP7F1D1_9ACTN